MLQQIILLSVLYVIGVLFIALFYPKISIGLIASSGLFWGGLINTFAGIILGLLGSYSGWIWIVLGIIFIILVSLHFRTKTRWKNISWGSILIPFATMFILFSFGYLFFGRSYQILTSSASLPYIIVGSHIYHYDTIFLPGAGYDFRSQYGISEALIHALGGFIHTPAISLWHPFLWISQYAFFFTAILEFSKKIGVKKQIATIIGLLALVWTATSPMNWMQSFYIHVHLFSSFSIMICIYFFWKMTNSQTEETELALLSSLALCGYGLSRVESPIMVLIILVTFFVSHKFQTKEYRLIFYPPILLEIGWLNFLLFAYKNTTTQYWSDSRLLLAIGVYSFLFVIILLNDFFKIERRIKWIKNHLYLMFLLVPIVLSILDYRRSIQTTQSVLNNMFGTLQQPGSGSWGLYWIEAVILVVLLLANRRPWTKTGLKKRNFVLFGNIIIGYLILILVLGFFRAEPYTGIRWGDSASRMLSHISPLLGLSISLVILEIFQSLKKERKKHKAAPSRADTHKRMR